MDEAYVIQFAGSAIAICVMAAVAAWARIARRTEPLSKASARALIAEELPEVKIEQVWIDAAGDTAVAKAGDEGVVLFRVGDSYAVRQAPWGEVQACGAREGRLVIAFGDPAAPAAMFKLAGESAPFAEAAR